MYLKKKVSIDQDTLKEGPPEKENTVTKGHGIPLTIQHTQGVFIVFSVGITAASVVFLIQKALVSIRRLLQQRHDLVDKC